MLKLHYTPATCALVVHIALEEAGLDYTLNEIDLSAPKPEYFQLNPLGRVPTLELEDGTVLTEVSALLQLIADRAPQRQLLPTQGLERIAAMEWQSLLASIVHPPFALFFKPQRFAKDPAFAEALKRSAAEYFFYTLRHVDERLSGKQWCVGDRFSLCDTYAYLFYRWGSAMKLPMQELPNYGALASVVGARPATRRALEQQGLPA